MKLPRPSLVFEVGWPWALASAAAVCWVRFGLILPESTDDLFAASASVASIFASFLGAALAVILTIKGTATYKAIETLGYATTLFGYIRRGIQASVAFACVSLIGFFLISESNVLWWFVPLWVFCAVLSLTTFYRITGLLFKLLRQV